MTNIMIEETVSLRAFPVQEAGYSVRGQDIATGTQSLHLFLRQFPNPAQ